MNRIARPSYKESKDLLSILREKYPAPVKGIGSRRNQYCVAGSLCLHLGWKEANFPDWPELRLANEKVTGVNHYHLSSKRNNTLRNKCEEVTKLNDAGEFDAAWELLGELLNLRPKRETSVEAKLI